MCSYEIENSKGAYLQCLSKCHIWTSRRENLPLGFANNKSADQSAHPQILISAFVICLLESIISRLASSEIPIFCLVSVAEQVDLYLILPETLKTDDLASWPKYSMTSTMRNTVFVVCYNKIL